MRTRCRRYVPPFVIAMLLLLTQSSATTWLATEQTPPGERAGSADDSIVVSRGLPKVRLKNGPALEPAGAGAVVPLALATADFDEDGTPDLVAGLMGRDGPVLALYRGNAAAMHGDDGDASFFFAPVTFELSVAPDFLAAGDFDADGHWDVVAASRHASALAWLPGNGSSEFAAARPVELPGAAIAMLAGELDRNDGLIDLAVSVSDGERSQVLLFAGPDGALQSQPGGLSLPGPSAHLVIGNLDDDLISDLGILVGDELLVYSGNPDSLAAATPANSSRLSRHSLGVHPVAVTAGNFDARDAGMTGLALLDGDGVARALTRSRENPGAWRSTTLGRTPAAPALMSGPDASLTPVLASARVSASAADDLIVIDRADRRVLIIPPADATATGGDSLAVPPPAILDLAGAPVAVLSMRLNGDAVSDLVILQDGHDAPSVLVSAAGRTLVVDSLGDEADCDITDNVCRIGPVDAQGKCLGPCTFRAALTEANVSSDLDAIQFAVGAGTPTIIKQGGADWTATSPVTISGNTGGATRVHLDANGSGNALIVRGGSSTIRNLVITRGGAGIFVHTNGGNLFEGNWIGLDPTGTIAWGNPGQGMLVTSPLNTIGGTASAARNVISGSGLSGIEIRNASGNKLLGNFIGTNATGTQDLGNALNGVYLELAGSTTIGGATAGARNVISGNNASTGGIRANISPNLVVQGNYIGTSASGTVALGNTGPGLRIDSGSNEIIGGTTAAARNVIAANGAEGLIIRSIGVSSKTVAQGNFIGVLANGTLAGNAGFGIAIQGTYDNTIGGTAKNAGNVIAGNGSAGVALQFAGVQPRGNAVRGNSIFSNASLGIDLGADGVTANDPCDADTGANGRQNAPVVTSVSGITTVQGTLNSTASTAFVLDFYSSPAPSTYEGRTFLGSKSVTTNTGCTAGFTATFQTAVPIGHLVSATATDPAGNTSEFSAGVAAPGAIAVSAPNTAVNWGIGTVQKIQWSHNLGAGSFVKVEVSRDGGATYSLLAASVKNGASTGTYNWMVEGPAMAQGRIRVTSLSGSSIADVSNANFTIAAPFVTVTRPTLSSHVWTIGTQQSIQWANNLGALENVVIELSTDGGVTYPIVVLSSTPSDGKQAVVVQAGWATPTARVRIRWIKSAAVSDTSDQNFAVQ